MPSQTFTSDFVTALGTYLGYGAIGLGLGVAVLSAVLLAFVKSDRALKAGTRFMMFGLALVVIARAHCRARNAPETRLKLTR